MDRLLAVMARLRDPERGCPWDVEQTFETIAPYTIEEAYEVEDAIRRGALDELREELGDLLLQVVFHAQMAREAGHFDFAGVVETLVDKLVRRHPHVFADAEVADAAAQVEAWEAMKAAERAERGGADGPAAALDAVPVGLPALLRAQKLARRAARAGLVDGPPDPERAWQRWRAALAASAGEDRSRRAAALAAPLGDLLLALAHSAAELGVDAEQALRDANARFAAEARRRAKRG